MSVLVVAATPLEAARLETGRATVVVTGMGAVNTAHGITCQLVTQPKPSLVIQMGIAGAYPGAGLSVGSAVLASEEMYGDVGVITPKGWFPAEEIGIPLVAATPTHAARFNRFPFDEGLVARASAICGPLLARTGRFLTLAQGTGVQALADSLYERFGALCESMEGAAAAHVCALYDVPFLEVRGISNLVEDRDRSAWRINEAAEAAQAVVIRLLDALDRLLELPGQI